MMTKYVGHKSLDAEVYINLFKGVVEMDYSLNKHFFEGNSSNSYYDFKDINWGLKEDFNLMLKRILMFLSSFILPFITILMIYAPKIREKYQYQYQKYIKDIYSCNRGINEYEVNGKLDRNYVEYRLDNNIWFEYELDGDYKEKIKLISFTRNVVTNELYGVKRKMQDGWNVRFDFGGNPENGKLVLRYLQ